MYLAKSTPWRLILLSVLHFGGFFRNIILHQQVLFLRNLAIREKEVGFFSF